MERNASEFGELFFSLRRYSYERDISFVMRRIEKSQSVL